MTTELSLSTDPDEGAGAPSLVQPIDLGASAPIENYERLARDLGGTQDRNAQAHIAIAEHHESIARHHRALAASVPDGDEAAANFGAVAVDHDLNGVKANVKMAVGILHDGLDRMDADHAAAVALRGELARLEGRMTLLENLTRKIAQRLGVE